MMHGLTNPEISVGVLWDDVAILLIVFSVIVRKKEGNLDCIRPLILPCMCHECRHLILKFQAAVHEMVDHKTQSTESSAILKTFLQRNGNRPVVWGTPEVIFKFYRPQLLPAAIRMDY
jgi:hypothetical protein